MFAALLAETEASNATDRDHSSLIRTASALIGGGSLRAQFVRVLGVFEGELAAAGDLAAARVAHAALGRLLGAGEETSGGATVVDLEGRRRDR